jgi:hypothetical protein
MFRKRNKVGDDEGEREGKEGERNTGGSIKKEELNVSSR